MRALSGTWLQPSAFYALWWCFAGILPLILAPNEPVGWNAMAWIIASAVAVSGGAIVGNQGVRTRLAVAPSPATDRELFIFGWIVFASVVLGFGSNVAFVAGSNVAFSDLLHIDRLVVATNQFYVQRYAEIPPAPPIGSRILLPFVYLAPAIGGILFVLRREKRWKLLGLLSFLPAVLVTILQTTKGAVLYAMLLWLSAYFGTRLRFGKLAVFTRSHLLVAVGVGGLLTAFFFAVSLARMATTDSSLIDVVVLKLLTSALGHMNVFSTWLAEYTSQPFNPALGTTTFAGPLELLGYSQRIPGLFEDLVELVAGETSNIYTAFRPLIQDFTMPGALAILTLLGFAGGAGFRMVAAGKWSGLPLLLLAYQTTMWTPITWLWVYNSLTATLAIVALLVFAIRLWRGNSARKLKLQPAGAAP
jgi:oligosaccharide repeat unit polymerase